MAFAKVGKSLTFKEAELLFVVDKKGVLRWAVDRRGTAKKGTPAGTIVHRYIRVCVNKEFYPAHHIVWLLEYGDFPGTNVDHKNNNGFDNRPSNLRLADHQENLQNLKKARSDSKSGLLGAHFHKGVGRWASRIVAYGVGYRLGYFDTAIEAHRAYLKAKAELHPYELLSGKTHATRSVQRKRHTAR